MEGFYAGDQVRFGLIAQDRYGKPLDLTGATVTFKFQCGTLAAEERDADVVDPTNPLGGKAEYWTEAADLTEGDLWWEWMVTDLLTHEVTGPFPRRNGKVIARLK